MAGGMKRAMIYLGLADGDEHYEEQQRETKNRNAEQATEKKQNVVEKPASPERQDTESRQVSRQPQKTGDDYRASVTPIKRVTQQREEASQVQQLTTIHPRSYNDAKLIGEAFRNNIPVIMNVTDMSESEAKRLVDFSAGLVFGLHGSIERVTNKVFLLTPNNVEVVTEGSAAPAEDSTFFNQA